MSPEQNIRINPQAMLPEAVPRIQGAYCTLWSDFDVHLFRIGRHYMLYKHLGAHSVIFNNQAGIYFSVWAPEAALVSVIGDFNQWNKEAHIMHSRWDSSGIWELFIPGLAAGLNYKFHVRHPSGYNADKADPFGFEMELPPHTASKTVSSFFSWNDQRWMQQRQQSLITDQALSIYELHAGSWRRVPEEANRWLTYTELAAFLPDYLLEMGFTHVELMPVMEHPFFGSWGYQVTGYFAPTSRLGTPADFKYLIDELHRKDIGVILDWVPAHFPGDAHGLHFFDGSHLYEHADPREGFHPDWQSYIFNYGRHEVSAFLISSAIYWLDMFHVDGLRVDGVASMLYRDYSRKPGEWVPNRYGGRENLEAIAFLQAFNDAVHCLCPGTFTVAEESTAFPGVTRPVREGGLGFDFKWMMGWMHDTLDYFKRDPVYRSYHQDQLTFSMYYFFSEKFILPLSHDEVVYGKKSLVGKMPGDAWQQMANLRLLYGYMFGHPGGKLLFMGGEFGQFQEWHHDGSLDWHLLDQAANRGLQLLVKDLNRLYRTEPALARNNYTPEGFEWIDVHDAGNSVICWLRKGRIPGDYLVLVANATPNVLQSYRIGVPDKRDFTELLNTDNSLYGGSGAAHNGIISATGTPWHHRPCSLVLTLPPLALVILKPVCNPEAADG